MYLSLMLEREEGEGGNMFHLLSIYIAGGVGLENLYQFYPHPIRFLRDCASPTISGGYRAQEKSDPSTFRITGMAQDSKSK